MTAGGGTDTAARRARRRLFLLSPARCDGERARLALSPSAGFALARRLRTADGAPLGEVMTFLSGLYFRGKLAYAQAFARARSGEAGVFVITPDAGLRVPATPVTREELCRAARVDIDAANRRYRRPLELTARAVAERLDARDEVVLLGSIASPNTSTCSARSSASACCSRKRSWGAAT